jgi:hypothetical protein
MLVAIAFCALSLTASAQNAPSSSSGAEGAPREGNIYNYQKHQPTTPTPAPGNTKQVDTEVKSLMKQMEELDRTFDQSEGKAPQRR